MRSAYRSGEVENAIIDNADLPHSVWRSDILPHDIMDFNVATLEDGARRVLTAAENWKAEYSTEPVADLELLPKS